MGVCSIDDTGDGTGINTGDWLAVVCDSGFAACDAAVSVSRAAVLRRLSQSERASCEFISSIFRGTTEPAAGGDVRRPRTEVHSLLLSWAEIGALVRVAEFDLRTRFSPESRSRPLLRPFILPWLLPLAAATGSSTAMATGTGSSTGTCFAAAGAGAGSAD